MLFSSRYCILLIIKYLICTFTFYLWRNYMSHIYLRKTFAVISLSAFLLLSDMMQFLSRKPSRCNRWGNRNYRRNWRHRRNWCYWRCWRYRGPWRYRNYWLHRENWCHWRNWVYRGNRASRWNWIHWRNRVHWWNWAHWRDWVGRWNWAHWRNRVHRWNWIHWRNRVHRWNWIYRGYFRFSKAADCIRRLIFCKRWGRQYCWRILYCKSLCLRDYLRFQNLHSCSTRIKWSCSKCHFLQSI